MIWKCQRKTRCIVLICLASVVFYISQKEILDHVFPKGGLNSITKKVLDNYINEWINVNQIKINNASGESLRLIDTLMNKTLGKGYANAKVDTNDDVANSNKNGKGKNGAKVQFANISNRLINKGHVVTNASELQKNDVAEASRLRKQYQSWFTSYEKTVKVENELYVMFEALVNILDSHNFTYLIVEGTLLGSYRHHGITPWDDDIDILVEKSRRVPILKALRTLSPKYLVTTYEGFVWRFTSSKVKRQLPGRSWSWPYIDILFYYLTPTHFMSMAVKEPRSHIFPLIKRPFGNMTVSAPCRPEKVLKKLYGNIDVCLRVKESHIHDFSHTKFKQKAVPCAKLAKYFPMNLVQRTSNGSMIVETLVKEGKVIDVKTFNNSCS